MMLKGIPQEVARSKHHATSIFSRIGFLPLPLPQELVATNCCPGNQKKMVETKKKCTTKKRYYIGGSRYPGIIRIRYLNHRSFRGMGLRSKALLRESNLAGEHAALIRLEEHIQKKGQAQKPSGKKQGTSDVSKGITFAAWSLNSLEQSNVFCWGIHLRGSVLVAFKLYSRDRDCLRTSTSRCPSPPPPKMSRRLQASSRAN